MKSATPNEDTLLKDHCSHEQEFAGFTTQSLELLQEQKQGENFSTEQQQFLLCRWYSYSNRWKKNLPSLQKTT